MRFSCGLLLATFVSVCAVGFQAQPPIDRDTLRQIEAAQQAFQTSPNTEANVVGLASLYLKIGQNQGAVEVLTRFLHSHADAPKTLRLLALAYLRKEDYTSANNAAESALRLGTRDSATVEMLAMAQLGLQATNSAERLFREALKLDPNSPEANLQLGLLYAKSRKNLPDAIRLLEKAATLQPHVAGTYAALGSAFLAAGDSHKAANALENAIKLAPDTAEPYYLLASAWRELQENDKAELALAAFNIRKKEDADKRARDMRGHADYEEGVNLLSNSDQLDKAFAALSKAASELPSFDPAYYRLAQVGYLKGDLSNALVSIRKALNLNPFEPEYYFVLARCLEDKDTTAALTAVEKAISLRSGVPDFEELLQELKAKTASK